MIISYNRKIRLNKIFIDKKNNGVLKIGKTYQQKMYVTKIAPQERNAIGRINKVKSEMKKRMFNLKYK